LSNSRIPASDSSLPSLPAQPSAAIWPTSDWSYGPQLTGDPQRLRDLLDQAFDPASADSLGETLACLVVQGGLIVEERYAPEVTAQTPLISWSVGKSITQAAVGILVADGLLDPTLPVGAPEWQAAGDLRQAITMNDLLEMRSGLKFVEDYVDDQESDCLEMLFGSGTHDVAGYAASQPLEHGVGQVFNYSSGTTNIIARHVAQVLGAGTDPSERSRVMQQFLQERLFGPLGMSTAEPRFDDAGTFIGSSYLFASAQDFARFGLLYLRDGVWDSKRILPTGWVNAARTAVSVDPEDGWLYGQHWWVRRESASSSRGTGSGEIFWANGYEKQIVMCIPNSDTVLVRLGKTTADQRDSFESYWDQVIAACTD